MISMTFVILSAFTHIGNAQTTLPDRTNHVGTWTLDSIAITRIERDRTETVVKYNDAKDIVTSIFDTIVFSSNRCQLKITGRETVSANYTLTDTLLTVVENEELLYQYKLDKSLTLKNIFFTKGHTVTQYNVEMRFIKQ
jgi:hypothetical protein